MDSTHTPQEKKTERKWGRVRRGGMERERERKRESPQDDSLALLSVQRAGVWLSTTENNKPSTTLCSAKLSLSPYLSLSPPFLSNPSPPLILPFSPWPFYCRPSFGTLLLLLYAMPPIPQARLQHLMVYFYFFLSLCSPFHSSPIVFYLPSRCICLSLSEVWETGVRGPCQTNQQYSLTAIPLCIWLCIWIPTAFSVSTTTDTASVDAHARGSFHHSGGNMWCTILAKALYQRQVNVHYAWTRMNKPLCNLMA